MNINAYAKWLFQAAIILLVPWIIFQYYLTIPGVNNLLFNSDTLLGEYFFQEAALGLERIRFLIPSGVIFCFPDVPLYSIIRYFSSSAAQAMMAYSVVQFSLFLVFGSLLYRTVYGRSVGWLLFFLLIYFIFLAVSALIAAPGNGWMFFYSPFMLGSHFATFLGSLMLFWLWDRHQTTGGTGWFAATAALLFVGVFSDPMLLTIGAIPLLVVWVYRIGSARISMNCLPPLIILVIINSAAMKLNWAASSVSMHINFRKNPINSLNNILAMFHQANEGGLLLLLLGSLTCLALAVQVSGHLLRWWRSMAALVPRQEEFRRPSLEIYLAVGGWGTFVSAILMDLFKDMTHTRYVTPLLFGTLLWAASLTARYCERRRLFATMGSPFHWLAGLGSLGMAGWLSVSPPGPGFVRPDYVDCFDARGQSPLLTDFWAAKPIRFLANHPPQVAQLNPAGEPYYWVNSSLEYVDSLPGELGRGPIRNFRRIFMKGMKTRSVLYYFGPPEEVTECAGESIWHYPDNHLKTRLYQMYQLAHSSDREPG